MVMLKTIQKRILFYILFSTILFIAFIGIFNYIYVQKIIVIKDEQRVSMMAKSTADNLSHYLSVRGQLAWSIAQNSTVKSFANNEHYRNENLYQNKDYLDLRSTFRNITSYYPDINSFYIAVPSHDRLYANIEREEYPKDYDIEKRPYFQAAVNKNNLVYTLPYWDPFTEEEVITAVMPFYNDSGDVLGIAAVDINESNIKRFLRDIPYLDGGYSFIINDDHIFLEHPNNDYYLKSLDELSIDNTKTIKQIINEKKSGISKIKMDNEYRYICYHPIDGTEWILGIVLPAKTVTDPMNTIGKASLTTILLAILLLSYLISLLMSKITNPIQYIIELIKKVEKGDYTVRAEVNSLDEFGGLAQSLNNSLDKQQQLLNRTIDSAFKIGLVGNEIEMLIGAAKSTLSILSFNTENKAEVDKVKLEPININNTIDDIINQITLISFNNQIINNCMNDQNWEEAYKNVVKNDEILQYLQGQFIKIVPKMKDYSLSSKVNTHYLDRIDQQLISLKNNQLDYLNKTQEMSGELLTLSNELIDMASGFKINLGMKENP